MIDKTKLYNEVMVAAGRWLSDLDSMTEQELRDNITYFGENCRDSAEEILGEYVREIYFEYTQGFHSIKNEEIRSRFNNLHNGYQQQMRKWIDSHHLELKDNPVEFPNHPNSEDLPKDIGKRMTYTLGAGLIIAVGLFIFTNIWIGIAAEILSIAVASGLYIKSNKDKVCYERDYKLFKGNLENKKNELIHYMLSELDVWLETSKTESDKILTSLGIQK